MTSKGKHKDGIPQEQAISEALDRDGKIYRKIGEYRARRVDVATPVETVLADGRKETRNVAAPGDYIVTGAQGEQYAVKPAVFSTRYELKPGTRDVYIARGHVVAIPNPFARPIYIVAPWGEIQHGSENCVIADMYDPASKKRAGQPYLIDRGSFDKTYRHEKPAWYLR